MPSVAAALCAIDDIERFVLALRDVAQAHGLPFDGNAVRQASRPDPINIARFAPKPPDGVLWPPAPWLPVHIGLVGDQVIVDWAWFGTAPLDEPFFESAIRRAMRRPFNRLFAYRMTLDDFLADAPHQRSLPPDGFIFHMSRCGSTLVSQMLAASPNNIIISEAAPIDAIVQLGNSRPQTSVAMLRAIIAAYGRKRSGTETRHVVKLDCWHALALPLFRKAFPATPWTFLYRDPVEVLVSHVRQRGGQLVPDITPPELYNLAADDRSGDLDYCARVLGRICEAAAECLPDGGLAIDYRDLPAALESHILPHFGIRPSAGERALMAQASRQDAKAPLFAFAADSAGKQAAAPPALRTIAETRLGAVYHRLEALKQA